MFQTAQLSAAAQSGDIGVHQQGAAAAVFGQEAVQVVSAEAQAFKGPVSALLTRHTPLGAPDRGTASTGITTAHLHLLSAHESCIAVIVNVYLITGEMGATSILALVASQSQLVTTTTPTQARQVVFCYSCSFRS